MDSKIQECVSSKRIAVVGVSRTPQKMGNGIYTELKQRGYEVFGVNPNLETIDGDKCYPSLVELAGKVDSVVICVHPQQSAGVLRDAAAAGIKRSGYNRIRSRSRPARRRRKAGLTL